MTRVSGPKIAPNLDWVVVEREFELRKGGKPTKVLARFGTPVADRHDFRCQFQIAGLLDKPIPGEAFGVDGVQALELTMQLATIKLMSSRAYQSGRLTFLGSHDLAMPLPKGMSFLTRWDLESRRVADESRSGADRKRSERAYKAMLAARPAGAAIRSSHAPVIVERQLELREGRKRTTVHVRFHQPVRNRHGFGCAFQIEGLLDRPPSRNGTAGTDTIGALRSAMQLAMIYILSSPAYQRGRLTWCGQYDLGLPVHEEIAPLIRTDLNAARFAQEMMVSPAKRSASFFEHIRNDPERLKDFNAMVTELNRATGSKYAPLAADRPSRRSTSARNRT